MPGIYREWMDYEPEIRRLLNSARDSLSYCFLYLEKNPTMSAAYGRKALEEIAIQLALRYYIQVGGLNLSSIVAKLESEKVIHPRIKVRMDSIRGFGNIAAHANSDLDEHDSSRNAEDLLFIVKWIVKKLTGDFDEDGTFSPPLRAGLSLLRKRIDQATQEQMSALDATKRYKRISISGGAGSGKTLLAMEKAARFDAAGLSVLYICHNPYLAHSVADSLIYTDVKVLSFNQMCALKENLDDGVAWSHYFDPSSEEIALCLDRIASKKEQYDAVIVDEAQDFRDEWWKVVEAVLSKDNAFLGIFSDSNQSLLPFRASYPHVEFQHSLIMNVRNACEIATAMRRFNQSPIETKPELAGGEMAVRRFRKGEETIALSHAISNLFYHGLLKTSFVISTDVVDPADSVLAGMEIPLLPEWRWQEAIRHASALVGSRSRRTKAPSGPQDRRPFPELSTEIYPTTEDVLNISKWARATLAQLGPKSIVGTPGSVWLNIYGPYISFAGDDSLPNVLNLLEAGTWAEQLPKPMSVKLSPVSAETTGLSLVLHTAASVKGLEADGVVTYVPTVISDLKAHAYVSLSRARLCQEFVILDDIARKLPVE